MSRRQAFLATALILFFAIGTVLLVYPGVKFELGKILPAAQLLPGFYEVTKVHDGDTFVVKMSGKLETIRLIGVDTPETHKPNWPVECYGPEATDFMVKTLEQAGNAVRLEADALSDNRDRYDRLLRYAYLVDGSLLQDKLLSGGYAFAYLSFPFSKHDRFASIHEHARKNNRGLWATCEPDQASSGRWQSNPLN